VTRFRGLFGGVIILYFIIALEVLIMISTFAAFFYAALNPVLLFFAQWPATHWLTAFFLPHMVVPPGLLLQTVRVAGSVLFVAGAVIFLVCAGQVYFHKFLRRGPALGGLYRWIRHPQYLGLGATGLGLAILWPRFLTIVLWAVMVELYYLLARDEERRNYIMQGMIADTGLQWRLYEHHQTLAMIANWILHPFRHLQGGHMMTHHNIGSASATSSAPGGVVRRLIFL
jgi:protein-S-isoprenylcysteine O-methyltransferase Ste14